MSNGVTDLDKLAKIVAERTPGPWIPWIVTTPPQETPSGEMIPLMHGAAPPHEISDVSLEKEGSWGLCDWSKKAFNDAAFIAIMGTCADELMAVVKAADLFLGGRKKYQSPGYAAHDSTIDAIAALKTKLAGMK